jgi:hypothetical protein
MTKRAFTTTPPARDARVLELMTRYEALLSDPEALIREGQRLLGRPRAVDEIELWVYCTVLLGHVAALEDEHRDLTLLCRATCELKGERHDQRREVERVHDARGRGPGRGR